MTTDTEDGAAESLRHDIAATIADIADPALLADIHQVVALLVRLSTDART